MEARQPMPSFTKFTVEPALAEHLYRLVTDLRPKHILELGCGLSTLVMSYALEETGQGSLEAFEQDQNHAEAVRGWLHAHQLDYVAAIHHTPIRNHVVPFDGMAYPWYSFEAHVGVAHPFDFVFIDGPSGHSAAMARWPAYFLLRPYLMPDAVLVADDMERPQEHASISHWLDNDSHLSAQFLKTERGAVILRRSYAQEGRSQVEAPSPQEGAHG